ncbi:hypothetical protein MG293_011005 [Ovis ammon polii]|uniref:Uncharacterized protein n=1 Tax=Ovis ammon polii TaxID=230172 RepID=A0AAD4Y8R8_OVIAM|nr:hypothetical protein MG293_011005 [Ovis ammon polii]KAI4565160.1 hypothetical protein MJT46_009503 [Ovis ammon polii x Ovis aries]
MHQFHLKEINGEKLMKRNSSHINQLAIQQFDLEDIKQALRNLNVSLVNQLTLSRRCKTHLSTSLRQNEHFEDPPENLIVFSIPTMDSFTKKHTQHLLRTDKVSSLLLPPDRLVSKSVHPCLLKSYLFLKFHEIHHPFHKEYKPNVLFAHLGL